MLHTLKSRYLLLLLTVFFTHVFATQKEFQSDLDYFSAEERFDPSIPKPSDVLGYTVGDWHVRHDQILMYMDALAKSSPRVTLVDIGKTHEDRRLVHLHISSPDNLSNLEEIRLQHMKSWEGSDETSDAPLIINMGYSVHGDESSGANTALLVAYYLAAAQSERAQQWLKNFVVILDPALNPDGLSRFAHWANSHKSKNLVADSNHREHRQGWPSARTNHYWFDLNRDWLLLTHPESRARVEQYQKWRPHILTDYHEMGTNSSYFFQPGVPSRTNPNTSEDNKFLTHELAKFHAKVLDAQEQLYFTQEGFDDFYYGKGSSYPDAQGTVGILFEQASARGHIQNSINGLVTFKNGIHNQLLTSLSTFEGALALKDTFLQNQRAYANKTAKLAKQDDVAGYLVKINEDRNSAIQMLDILKRHKIKVYPLKKDIEVDEITFSPGRSFFVPTEQHQYRLIKSLFSNRKSFENNTFYDVSNWNIAYAFNLTFKPVESSRWRKVTLNEHEFTVGPEVVNSIQQDAVAFAFSWTDSNATTLLQKLLDKDVFTRVTEKSFSAETHNGIVSFTPGSIIIHNNSKQPENTAELLAKLGDELQIRVFSITSGFTPQGSDLGSRFIVPVENPKVLLVGGTGISQYEAGEVWHYLDTVVGKSPSIVEFSRLQRMSLNKYSHIIFVDGSYSTSDQKLNKKLTDWVKQGGVVIAQKRAAKWLSDLDLLKAKFGDKDSIDSSFDTSTYNFAAQNWLAAKKRVAGAVFLTDVDVTHPLLYGFSEDELPIFRNSNLIMKKPAKPFVSPIVYNSTPLIAGYASQELQELIANTASVVAHKVGHGRVIALVDNVNFRGYWRGTRRLLSNALYMHQFIDVEG